ncbi:MAG: ABC transporter substrate-binding protein [Methanothrix sp.]|uniref:ABC transporter substrate-binding protein n=1 Tax=Methanothrix sp. TaxID=90426 RepID=UPI003165EF7F|nr:ABC transporter substrate-binding protein [Methanothrix sp.]
MHKRSAITAFVCFVLAVSAVSCEEVTVRDDLGRDVTISSPSERIVFMMENALKTYYAVGDPKNIVALKDDRWMRKLLDDIFPVIDPDFEKKLTISVAGDRVDLESLARANPDLVVLWATTTEDVNIQAIEETLGVPVFAIFVRSVEDVLHQVDTMGAISGRTERAAEVKRIIHDYMNITTGVTSSIPESERPKVYWMWTDVLGTAGVKSGINDIIELAGGVNVMKFAENDTAMAMEHPVLNLETLIKLNPDVIYMWYNENLDPEDIMTGEDFKGWKDINAVKNGRVYEIRNPYLFDAFSPRMPLALLHIAMDLHPDRFKDVDMNKTIDDFHVEMWGVHYPSMERA